MPRITICFILLSYLFLSCADATTSTERIDIVQKASMNTSNQGKSCLRQFQAEPWNLFTLEEIATFVDLPASEGRVGKPMKMKNPASNAAGYKWDSDRTISVKVGDSEMKVPATSSVTFGRFTVLVAEEIQGSFLDHFKNQYRVPTEKEQAAFDKAFEKELEKESEETKVLGRKMADLTRQYEYRSVDGIGTAAAWETNPKTPDGLLHVLHHDMTFVVVINLSDVRDYNLEMAKKIALEILAKCD